MQHQSQSLPPTKDAAYTFKKIWVRTWCPCSGAVGRNGGHERVFLGRPERGVWTWFKMLPVIDTKSIVANTAPLVIFSVQAVMFYANVAQGHLWPVSCRQT